MVTSREEEPHMNRYCLVCEKEYGPYVDRSCVQGSLVCTKTEGLFKKARKWYALDGKELTPQELDDRRQAAREKRQEQQTPQQRSGAASLLPERETSREQAYEA